MNITIIISIIAGVTIFVLGRMIDKFILEPIQEYKKAVANIIYTLIFYANIYSNAPHIPDEIKKEASRAIRMLSAELYSKIRSVNCYNFFSKIRWIPKYVDSTTAARHLMNLSNSLWSEHFGNINETVEKIKVLLQIEI